jgi:hypothetical protein
MNVRCGRVALLSLVAGCGFNSAVPATNAAGDGVVGPDAGANIEVIDAAAPDALVPLEPDAFVVQPSCWTDPAYDVEFAGHRYKLAFGESVRAYQAHEACLADGAHVVTLEDQSEDDFFHSFTGYGRIFIGAHDGHAEGNFRWLTGDEDFYLGGQAGAAQTGFYENFNQNEPNNAGGEDCADKVESSGGGWNDQECDTLDADGRHGYVCECEPGLVFTQPGWLPPLN